MRRLARCRRSAPDARTHTEAGLPWFTWWEAEAKALSEPVPLAALRSLRHWAGDDPPVEVPAGQVIDLSLVQVPDAIVE